MNRQLSLSQYRSIDLTILMILLAASQWVIGMASSQWFPEQMYVVTPVAAVVALVMMRWGPWALIHAALGGLFYALFAKGNWQQMLIYGVGNLAGMLGLVLLKLLGKERVRQDGFLSLLFAFTVQLMMWLGRAGVALALSYPAEICLKLITTDILSGLFVLVIIWIVRRIDGLFEDQKHYLLRTQQEQQNEGREQF